MWLAIEKGLEINHPRGPTVGAALNRQLRAIIKGATQKGRETRATDQPRPAIWTSFICTIPSAVVTQALASAGADVVVIDQEHGAIGPETLHAMIAATAGAPCLPFVRVGRRDEAMVKLALDMGAAGIAFPMVNDAEEAADCAAMTRYPPHGRRGFGPFIGHSRWAVGFFEYLPRFDDKIACNILIETWRAIENVDSICAAVGSDWTCSPTRALLLVSAEGIGHDGSVPSGT